MDTRAGDHPTSGSGVGVQRASDRELVITRLFDAPPPTVFRAWADPALFRQWWAPKGAGLTLLSCDMDVRTGGAYRLEFAVGGGSMAFFGRYLEVVPDARIVWTNEEEGDAGAITTVTFEDRDGKTLLTFHELYPSREALDEAMSGSAQGLPTQLEQLDDMLRAQGRSQPATG